MAVLDEEIRRQRAADALLSLGDLGEDDSAPRYETKSAEYVGTGDNPIPKPVEEHYGDWKKWDTIEPLTAESVVAKPDDSAPKYETKSAEYVGTGDDWRKWPTIAEDQTGAPSPVTYPKIAQDQTGALVAASSADQPAPDTLSQVERATLVKPPVEAPDTLTQVERATLVKPPQAPTEPAPDTLKQVERAQLVKLPDNIPRGTITTPVEPITPQEPTQAPPQVQRAELVPAPQPTGPKAPGAHTELAPVGKMDLRPDTEQAPTTQAPTTQPAVKPISNDWRTWITADGTQAELPGAAPTEKVAPTELKAGEGNRVEAGALYSYLASKFADSDLVGYVPPDGAKWGITTGSAAEWAAFGLAVAKQESDLNTRSYNASDPGGSVGLFQFGQGQTRFTDGRDQFDPQASADAFVKSVQHYVGNQGNVSNLGATFGSIRRPNEAGQYIGYAQDVAAKNGGSTAVVQPAKQPDWMSWPTLAPAEQTAAETAGLTRQRNALDDLNRKTENPGQFYKSLDQPIAGVTDANRKAYQENFKQELTKYAQNFYGETDPDKAFQRAIGDANLGTFLQDTGRSILGTAGQFDVGLNKAAKDIDFNRLDQFAKVIHPESDGPGRAAFIKTITSIADPTVRAQAIGKIIAALEPAKQAALNSVDIADSADRVASPEYQAAQNQAIALKDVWVQKQMEADPTLKGTPGQWWSGQIGSFLTNAAVSTAAAPVRTSAFIAQLYGQARDRIKADHPDWTDDQVGTEAAKTSFLQQLPQEALMAALQGKMGPLAAWIGKVKNPVVRFGLGGGTHLATGAAAGALQQVGANVGEGKPILENVPQAALGGAVQAAPFAIHGGLAATTAPEQPVIGERGGALRGPTDQTLEQPPAPTPAPQLTPEQQFPSPEAMLAEQARRRAGAPPPPPVEAPSVTQEDVARRTYELGQARAKSGQPGTAADDYAQAQKELSQATGPIIPGTMSEAEPINSAIANRYTAERMATGELGQIDPSQGKSTEDLVNQGLKMSPTQREGLIDNFTKSKGGDLDQQGAAIRSKEAILSEQSRAASRAASAEPTNPQLQAQAKAAADAVTAFHNGPIKKFKQVWSNAGRGLQREIPLDYTTFNGMKEAYLKGNNQEAPPNLEPKLKRMAEVVSKNTDAERVAMNNLGKEIERQTRGRALPANEQIRTRLMEIMKDLPCRT
jgi:hypothetical protein